MCGISGVLFHTEASQMVDTMVKVQHHRGPDATRKFVSEDKTAALGFNRLSIIDLSEQGKQPMYSEDKRYVLVFNGEVYNYKELKSELQFTYSFKSQTDSEVVLAAWMQWGEKCLDKLIGMFAFAIWDTASQTLFAARDRFGVKPFYFSVSNKSFRFASEIKALWASGIEQKKQDQVWANYFCYGTYGLPHQTFWEQIEQLPAGHFLTYSLPEGAKIKKWYTFEENISTLIAQHKEDITATYEALLIESINLRFRSEVPVGFNISGGLDSSTLLALVNKCFPHSPIEAYTFYTGDSRYDELEWVEPMIAQTGNPLHKCKLTVDEIPALLQKVSYYQDEPFGGIPTLAYAKIFEQAQENGTKVLLDGQGMDEAWAGYDYYHNDTAFNVQGVTSSPYHIAVLSDEFKELAIVEKYASPFDNRVMNLQYRDLFYTKIPRALRFNDRISMMYSTEVREPFLDHRLVELAFSRPYTEKYHDGNTKWMLRKLVHSYLGSAISLAPKRAMQTPQREWLANELKPLVIQSIDKLDNTSYFKKGKLLSEYIGFCTNPAQSVNIWQYISLASLL